jgi:L-ascorbate metabolism protein UlaG (beta-lactamase superfamily)
LTVTIRCLAHACFQIRTDSQSIYIDPSTKNTGLKKDDFKPADLILVTHGHSDHFDKDLLKKIRKPGSPVIAPENLRKEMKGIVMWDMSPGQMMQMTGGVTIWATNAYNVKRFRSPGNPFHPKDLGVGYIIKLEDKKIYHAGDTDLIPEMEKVAGAEVDVALLPSGDTYTMDMKEAAEAALIIKPKVVIPMHLWDKDPAAFKSEVEAKSSIKVVILGKGEEYTIE